MTLTEAAAAVFRQQHVMFGNPVCAAAGFLQDCQLISPSSWRASDCLGASRNPEVPSLDCKKYVCVKMFRDSGGTCWYFCHAVLNV